MPRLIVKVNYGKTKSYNLNYVNYIATREGVEKLPIEQRSLPATDNQLNLIHELLECNPDLTDSSEYRAFVEKRTIETASELISSAVEEDADNMEIYMNYIATRPRAEKFGGHGLFSDEDNVDLEAEKKIIQAHSGNVWRFIISLSREDAERIGYDNASAWRDLMRSQRTMLAEQMKIPLSDLRWVGAFHNERHHPHIHMMVYSKNPSKGFLTEQGLEDLKSELANEMFKDELLTVYKEMSQRRDDLTEAARMRIRDLIDELKTSQPEECDHMVLLKAQMNELAKKLSGVRGKHVYGYLPPALKNLVDEATDTLAKDPRINELYTLWYEKKYDSLRTYTDHLPEQIPLSNNKQFRAIKNAIVKAASSMTVDLPTDETPIEAPIVEGEQFSEAIENIQPLPKPQPEPPNTTVRNNSDIFLYLFGKELLTGNFSKRDPVRAEALLQQAADHGSPYAAYTLGKAYLKGDVLKKDLPKAIKLLEQAVTHEDIANFAAYSLGTIYLKESGYKNPTLAIKYLAKASEGGNHFADYLLGKAYLFDKDFPQDQSEGMQRLHSAADQGNVYAAQLLNSMQNHAVSSLLSNTARVFTAAMRRQQYAPRNQQAHDKNVDSRLRREIEAKKHGQDYAG